MLEIFMKELGSKLSISLKWGCKGDVGDLRPISLKVGMVCPSFP
jgi:hypothetical protein